MERLFDAHIHHLFEMPLEEAVRIFKKEFPMTGTERQVFLSIPNDVDPEGNFYIDHMQNIRMLYLKYAFSPKAYAFAGLEHPLNVSQMSDQQLSHLYLKQAEEYFEVGYDGMKMLEGYPSMRKAMKRSLCDKVYDRYYSFLEENNIPVTMHIANPETFWDISKIDEYSKKMGRGCDETYPTKSQLHEEVDGIMKKHPKLRLILAHFGFMCYDIRQARQWLDAYENTMIDLTPGGEQFFIMLNNWDEWYDFFVQYQDRIIYGSDYYAFPQDEKWEENFQRRPKFLRDFFETNTEHLYNGRSFCGVDLAKDIRQKIYWDNSMRMLGEPKTIDLAYFKKKAEELLAIPNKRAIYADADLQYILKSKLS